MPVKHPFTGGAQLVWEHAGSGDYTALISRQAKYKKGKLYTVEYWFATVRKSYGVGGLVADLGWVVSRHNFAQLQVFDSLDEAKQFVNSLYEMQK